MKSFKGFLAEGRSRGEDMEEAIVSLWNGVSISNDLSDGAQKVVDYLKTKGVSGQDDTPAFDKAQNIDTTDWKFN